MGTGAGVGLWIFGVARDLPRRQDATRWPSASSSGSWSSIPYVGPFLGALPPMLVALFQDPLTAVWVALLFVALQQLEGHVVAPQVFGHTLRINPLLVIFALLLGGQLYGIIGALRRAAGRRGGARDGRLPAPPPRARAVGRRRRRWRSSTAAPSRVAAARSAARAARRATRTAAPAAPTLARPRSTVRR